MPKQSLIRHYRLCKRCLERHSCRGRPGRPCYICRGLMDKLDDIANNILDAVKCFEFNTFLIGAKLPTQLYEREDSMRARLKIRGSESIKQYLTRELGMQLARRAQKEVEYGKPDIVITLTIDKENNVEVAVLSRPLTFAGVYTKKSRGLPQKQDKCAVCGGIGCNSCNYSGLSAYESVEGIIAKALMDLTRGQTPKFMWMGSEDADSRVLGSGRPFFARIFNPRKRNFEYKTIKGKGIKATLNEIGNVPAIQPRFTIKTKIHVRCENSLNKTILNRLNFLSGCKVTFKNKSKKSVKSIHSIHSRKVDCNDFILTIEADSGIMIKQFVHGEQYARPNISEILGMPCKCVTFDILDVRLQ
ncbi:MAG: tRNA pseudouridine(54/55) synthase Pus10 [Nitrososphaera sp.]